MASLLHWFMLIILLASGSPAAASLLPGPSCGAGWMMEGKSTTYDRTTLSDRINGEAELYFPYGFERMLYARYNGSDGAGFDVDVYQVGSVLDAFGVYATYRPKEGKALSAGAEAVISGGQLFLYQDRYFVRIEATGSPSPPAEALLACARIVAAGLPGKPVPPLELATFSLPGIQKGSERYLAQSLLGYDFFRRGLMAEAVTNGAPFQIFLVLEESPEQARKVFERYVGEVKGTISGSMAEGTDPLYGKAVVGLKGRFVAGAVRLSDTTAARKLVEELLLQLTR